MIRARLECVKKLLHKSFAVFGMRWENGSWAAKPKTRDPFGLETFLLIWAQWKKQVSFRAFPFSNVRRLVPQPFRLTVTMAMLMASPGKYARRFLFRQMRIFKTFSVSRIAIFSTKLIKLWHRYYSTNPSGCRGLRLCNSSPIMCSMTLIISRHLIIMFVNERIPFGIILA